MEGRGTAARGGAGEAGVPTYNVLACTLVCMALTEYIVYTPQVQNTYID